MTEWRASVRQVVEFSLHERALSPAAFAAKRMREGAAAHKARQSAGAREETAYQAEKSLSADYAAREIILRVTGRADGLLLAADGAVIFGCTAFCPAAVFLYVPITWQKW